MINNAWKINEGDKTYAKGWSNKDEDAKNQNLNSGTKTFSRG